MAYIYCFSYGLSDCRIIATAPFIWVTDNSARKREQLGPYEKTTRTINNYCCLTYFVNFKGEGTHDTTFSEKILDFYKILEESEQFFILFLKKMENLRRLFSIFEVRGGIFFNVV